MGNICCGEKEIRLILVGIDLAGKTTVLNQLRYKETKTTTPTVGFNFETVIYKKFSMSICDTGGQDRIRDLWKHYFEQVHGVLYVVDSTDSQRIQESKNELHKALLDENLNNAFLGILANKRDLEDNCMEMKDIESHLDLQRLPGTRRWKLFPISALKGSGLDDVLQWVSKQKLIV